MVGRIQVLSHWQLEIKAEIQILLEDSKDREELREMIASHPQSRLISEVVISVSQGIPEGISFRLAGLSGPVSLHRVK